MNTRIFKNIYSLDEDIYIKCRKIVSDYYTLLTKEELNTVSLPELTAYLLAISESFEFFENQQQWTEKIYDIIYEVRSRIYTFHPLALFGGLGEFAMAVHMIKLKTGHFHKFSNQIDQILINNINELLDRNMSTYDEVKIQDYDIMAGVSGCAHYFLTTKNKEYEEVIKRIMQYLLTLINISENNKAQPYFVVKPRNLIREDEKKLYINGVINLGISHGILGPLYILSEGVAQGILDAEDKKKIYGVLEIYDKNWREINTVKYWPGQLSYEDYLSNKVENLCVRMSWCYGSITTSLFLYKIYENLKEENSKELCKKNILNIAKLNTSDYYFDSAIVCHGYSGLLAILDFIYRNEFSSPIISNKIKELIKEIVSLYDPESKYGFTEVIDGEKNENNTYLSGTSGVVISMLPLLQEHTCNSKLLLL